MVACRRCGKENEDGRDTCVRCGVVLAAALSSPVEPQAPSHFCHWHPKVATALSCGRCGRYVCPKCVKLGPAGPRCKDCARSGVAVRPAGVAHEARVVARRWISASPWLTLVVLLTLGSTIVSYVRGCIIKRDAPPAEVADTYELGD